MKSPAPRRNNRCGGATLPEPAFRQRRRRGMSGSVHRLSLRGNPARLAAGFIALTETSGMHRKSELLLLNRLIRVDFGNTDTEF